MVDQLISSAANFFTGVVIGRACSQDQLGQYLLGLSIIVAVMVFQNSFISAPYSVFSPRLTAQSRATYVGSSLLYQFSISTVAILVLLFISSFEILIQSAGGLSSLLLTLAVVIEFILIRELIRQFCFANLDYFAALIIDSFAALFQISGLIFVAHLGFLNANFSFLVIGFVNAIVAIFWLIFKRHEIYFSTKSALVEIRNNWTMGRWIFSSGLLWQSNVIVYPWLLTYFHGTASTGVWAACFGIVAIANPLLLGVENLIGPEMAHSYANGGGSSLKKSVSRMTIMFSILIVPFSLGIGIFGDQLITAFYGEKFAGNGVVVVPLALSMLVSPARSCISRALVVMEHANVDFSTNISSIVVLCLFGVWLTDKYGPYGVACAVLAGNVTVTLAKSLAYMALTRDRS